MRQETIWVLILGFCTVLAGLFLFGTLSWQGAFGGALAGISLLLFYANGLPSEQSEVPVASDGLTSHEAGEVAKDAQQMVISALSQPALIVRGNQVDVFNEGAASLFSLVPDTRPAAASLRHPSLLAGIQTVQATAQAYECEIEPARAPGQNWLAHLTALVDGPGLPDVLIVLTDLSPVRSAERARADFLANASHELRTPLTSISGFVETMQGVGKDDKDAWPRFIDIIAEQASHMRGLISDLLSLSRIELGAHELPEAVIDLRLILSESIEALGHSASGRGGKIHLEFSEDLGGERVPLKILGSESEVKQVVQNLLGNAIKYSPEGGEITVRAGRMAAADLQKITRSWTGANAFNLFSSPAGIGPNGSVWFSVCDQGPGIGPEYLPRLGERFFRVDDSRGGPVEGTGLGLAIVKHIMAHHQGGFAVESVVGQGAQFTVWFQAAVALASDQ